MLKREKDKDMVFRFEPIGKVFKSKILYSGFIYSTTVYSVSVENTDEPHYLVQFSRRNEK